MKRSVKLLSAVCLFLLAAVIASCNDTEQPTEGFTVTWVNYDGTVLEVDRDVPVNTVPEYNGTAPKRKCEGKYGFGFSGWSPAVEAVTGNRTYVAQYDVNPHRTVNVIWKNEDGNVLKNAELPYGADYEYEGEPPEKENDEEARYDFDRWTREEQDNGDTVIFTAMYKSGPSEYKVKYVNYNGVVLEESQYIPYGTRVAQTHRMTENLIRTPVKESDNNGRYRFIGWEPRIESITEDVTFTAVFETESFFITSKDKKTVTGVYYEDLMFWKITEAAVPDGVEVIAKRTFKQDYGSFKNIILPESVKVIEAEAFTGGLNSINIPAGVTEIADDAFIHCPYVNFTVDENNPNYVCIDGALVERSTGKVISFGTCSRIPDSYYCRTVGNTAHLIVKSNPFYVPGQIESIAPGSVILQREVRNICVDPWNETYYSDGNCVIKCDGKKLILGCRCSEIPDDGSVTVIGNRAFAYCSAPQKLSIPGTVVEIEEEAFLGCTDLFEVSIGDGLEIIGPRAFAGCTDLDKISIPATVKYIAPTAFDDMTDKPTVFYYGSEKQWTALTKDFGEKLNQIAVVTIG